MLSLAKKVLLITIVVLMLSTTAMADKAATQTLRWETFWGGSRDESGGGIFISGGNIYVSGYTTSFGAERADLVILKCDLSGKIICDKTLGGVSDEFGRKVYVSDGNIYVAGSTFTYWNNAAIWKFDSYCNLVWYRLWGCPDYPGGYDNMIDLFVVGDDIYCVGDTEFGWGNPLLLLQRYDTEGNLKWTTFWGPRGYDVHTTGRGITVSGGDIYVVGHTETVPGPYNPWDALVMRYDASGNLIWSRTWGGTSNEYAYGISVLGNDIYVVGYTDSFGVGGYDIFLLKYDSAGNLIWYKTWGGSEDDLGYEICISNDQIYVAGTTKSFGAGGYDAVTLKTDLSGNPIWYETWGGTAEDMAHDLHVLGNEIYVVGHTGSFGAGGRDIFILKYTDVIAATIDIDPDDLNLKSKGKWITAYIELHEGYHVSDIDIYSIMLNDTIPISLLDVPAPEPVPTEIGDHDEDGIPDLMVKFNRTKVSKFILSTVITNDRVTLTIAGEVDGTPFRGNDTIEVVLGAGGCKKRR